MNPDDLARILDELGERLGPAGEHVFQLAVRQAYLTGAIGTTVATIGLLITCAAVPIVSYRMYAAQCREYDAAVARDKYHYGLEPDTGFWVFITGLAVFGGLMVFGYLLWFSLLNLLNPEYAALRDILGTIGGVR